MKPTNNNLNTFKPEDYLPNKLSYVKDISTVPKDSIMDVDVLFVGAGPAGLTGALKLKQLCKAVWPDIQIAVLEKASRLGGHSLSGAVVNPVVLKSLFPDLKPQDLPLRQKVKKEHLFYLSKNKKWPLPLAPSMHNKGMWTASLCEIVRWLGDKASAEGVNVWTSYSADKLLVNGDKINGVSTTPIGLNKDGSRKSNYQPAVFIRAGLTVLADGSRGHLSQAWMRWKNISSHYPQMYALGVKEIWEVPPNHLIGKEHSIIHTMGWPLPPNCFGGSWIYPLGKNLLSIGLVADIQSPFKQLNTHEKLQELKTHPLLANLLKKGQCVEWGAKTLPEGGYHALPDKLSDDGLLIIGDAAGMVNVPALKGIHYAMKAGVLSAEQAFLTIKSHKTGGDTKVKPHDMFSHLALRNYDWEVKKNSFIGKDLYKVRHIRQAFNNGLFLGIITSGLIFAPYFLHQTGHKFLSTSIGRVFINTWKKLLNTPQGLKLKRLVQKLLNTRGGRFLAQMGQKALCVEWSCLILSTISICRKVWNTYGKPIALSVGHKIISTKWGLIVQSKLNKKSPPKKTNPTGKAQKNDTTTQKPSLLVNKLEGVYLSGNQSRDDMPSHLLIPKKDPLPPEVQKFYTQMCPAGVYESQDGKLLVQPSNCIDCKATDVFGPAWSTREGGAGPRYQRM